MRYVVAAYNLSTSPAAAPVAALVLCAAEKGAQSKCRAQVPIQGGQTADPT